MAKIDGPFAVGAKITIPDRPSKCGRQGRGPQGSTQHPALDVEPVLERTKHGHQLALLGLQVPHHSTLMSHQKVIPAQLGLG